MSKRASSLEEMQKFPSHFFRSFDKKTVQYVSADLVFHGEGFFEMIHVLGIFRSFFTKVRSSGDKVAVLPEFIREIPRRSREYVDVRI